MRVALGLLALASFLLASAAGARPTWTPSEVPVRTWVPDGFVNAIVPTDDAVYIGGHFGRLSRRTGPGVVLDRKSGRQLAPWPELAGVVTAAQADGRNGFYVAGTFTKVAGLRRVGLVHLLADGSVDEAFDAPVRGVVLALALADGRLYVAGAYTRLGGQPRGNIASVDAATGRALPWAGSVNAPVNALAVAGGRVFAGGDFTRARRTERRRLAAFGATSGRLLAWKANVIVTPHDGLTELPAHVDALGVNGRTLYVGGYFDRVNGKWRTSAAAVDTRTGAVRRWKLPLGEAGESEPVVTGFAFDARHVYAVGVGGLTGACVGLIASDRRTGRIRWRALGCGWTNTVVRAGRTIYVGGYDGLFAAIDLRTHKRREWGAPRPNGSVYALAASASSLYVGGGFTGLAGVGRASLAALDAHTGEPTSWNPRVNGFVSTMARVGDTLYLEGYLRRVGGKPRTDRLAAVNMQTGAVLPWGPRYAGSVFTMLANERTLFVGGDFTRIAGQSRRGLAAFDAATGALKGWRLDVPAGGSVYSLAMVGSTLYVAGGFRSIGGLRRPGLAAVDASTGTVLPWTPATDGWVGTVGADEHAVFAREGEKIVTLDPVTGARIDPTLELWASGVEPDGSPRSAYASALASVDGVLYLGGQFDSVNGADRGNAAAVDARTGVMLPWNPRLDGSVETIQPFGRDLHVGGAFGRAGDTPQARVAVFPGS